MSLKFMGQLHTHIKDWIKYFYINCFPIYCLHMYRKKSKLMDKTSKCKQILLELQLSDAWCQLAVCMSLRARLSQLSWGIGDNPKLLLVVNLTNSQLNSLGEQIALIYTVCYVLCPFTGTRNWNKHRNAQNTSS